MEESFYNQTGDNRESGGYDRDKISFLLSEIGTGKKILDVGCNDGFIGALLMKNGNKVYGFDIARKNIVKARKAGMNVLYFKIGSGPFPYKSNYFDIVFLGDIIEHVFDTDDLLRESHRILKPGGSVILSTPDVASFGRRIMLLLGISPFLEFSLELDTNGFPSVGHIRYYTVDTMRRQLEYQNFFVQKIIGNGVYITRFLKFPFLGKIFPSWSSILFCVAKK